MTRTNKIGERVRRWTRARKIELMRLLTTGELTMQQAQERYALTQEELECWKKRFDTFGCDGLCATKVQDYRLDDTDDTARAA